MQKKEENLLGEVYAISDKLKMEIDKKGHSLSEFEGTSEVERVEDLIKGNYGTTEGERFYPSPLVSKAVEENGSSMEVHVSADTPKKSDEQMSESSFHLKEKTEDKRVEIISAGTKSPSKECETPCEMNNVENPSIPLTAREDVSSANYKMEGTDAEAIKSPGDTKDEKAVKDENDYDGNRNIFISPKSEYQRGEDEKKEIEDGEDAGNVLVDSFVNVVEETRLDDAESDMSGKQGDNPIEKGHQDVADHPAAEGKTEELAVEEKYEEPMIEEEPKEPIVTEKYEKPAVDEKTEEPAVEEKPEEPVEQEKLEETEVQEIFEKPVVEEKPEVVVVEEAPKEPTQEKRPEELEFEEKPEELLVEETTEQLEDEEKREKPAVEEEKPENVTLLEKVRIKHWHKGYPSY